jgi:hypothetical protein
MRSASACSSAGVLVGPVVARHQRHAGALHELLGLGFEAHVLDGRRRRADEDQAGLGTGAGEVLVLAQEAVAGVDRLRAGGLGGLDDAFPAQVAVFRRVAADVDRLVAGRHMLGVGVRVGVHGHGADGHAARGGGNTAGNLATVGNQDFGEHQTSLWRTGKQSGQAAQHRAQELEQQHRDHPHQHHGDQQHEAEDHRVRGREPHRTHHQAVFDQAGQHVGKRLGRGVDRRARGGLGGLAGRRQRATQQRREGAAVAPSAPSAAAARAAPAGMRITLCIRSQSESTPGILSAKNSTHSSTPLAISRAGCCKTARPGGSAIQPACPAAPTRNTTAYRRKPLAQPSAAASASRLGRSMAPLTWVPAAAIEPAARSSRWMPMPCSP